MWCSERFYSFIVSTDNCLWVAYNYGVLRMILIFDCFVADDVLGFTVVLSVVVSELVIVWFYVSCGFVIYQFGTLQELCLCKVIKDALDCELVVMLILILVADYCGKFAYPRHLGLWLTLVCCVGHYLVFWHSSGHLFTEAGNVFVYMRSKYLDFNCFARFDACAYCLDLLGLMHFVYGVLYRWFILWITSDYFYMDLLDIQIVYTKYAAFSVDAFTCRDCLDTSMYVAVCSNGFVMQLCINLVCELSWWAMGLGVVLWCNSRFEIFITLEWLGLLWLLRDGFITVDVKFLNAYLKVEFVVWYAIIVYINMVVRSVHRRCGFYMNYFFGRTGEVDFVGAVCALDAVFIDVSYFMYVTGFSTGFCVGRIVERCVWQISALCYFVVVVKFIHNLNVPIGVIYRSVVVSIFWDVITYICFDLLGRGVSL
eukprot:gene3168-2150_t